MQQLDFWGTLRRFQVWVTRSGDVLILIATLLESFTRSLEIFSFRSSLQKSTKLSTHKNVLSRQSPSLLSPRFMTAGSSFIRQQNEKARTEQETISISAQILIVGKFKGRGRRKTTDKPRNKSSTMLSATKYRRLYLWGWTCWFTEYKKEGYKQYKETHRSDGFHTLFLFFWLSTFDPGPWAAFGNRLLQKSDIYSRITASTKCGN